MSYNEKMKIEIDNIPNEKFDEISQEIIKILNNYYLDFVRNKLFHI